MRCKVGDLAVIVGGLFPENIGRMVDVLSWDADEDMWLAKAVGSIRGICLGKVVEKSNAYVCADDRHLRPIRPGDGQDETLAWKPVPTETVREVIEAMKEAP